MSILPRVSFLDKLFMTRHLAVMLKAGITLPEALEIIGKQSHSRQFKRMMREMEADVRNGLSLKEVLGKWPADFDSLYRSVVGIGEESGTLKLIWNIWR